MTRVGLVARQVRYEDRAFWRNPVVAVFLGWLILSEPITGAVLVGGGIVVAAVAIVITAERPRRKPLPEGAQSPERVA